MHHIDRTRIDLIHNKKAYQQSDLACLHSEVEMTTDRLDEFVVQIYAPAVRFHQSAQPVQKFAARVEAFAVQELAYSQQELAYSRRELAYS